MSSLISAASLSAGSAGLAGWSVAAPPSVAPPSASGSGSPSPGSVAPTGRAGAALDAGAPLGAGAASMASAVFGAGSPTYATIQGLLGRREGYQVPSLLSQTPATVESPSTLALQSSGARRQMSNVLKATLGVYATVVAGFVLMPLIELAPRRFKRNAEDVAGTPANIRSRRSIASSAEKAVEEAVDKAIERDDVHVLREALPLLLRAGVDRPPADPAPRANGRRPSPAPLAELAR